MAKKELKSIPITDHRLVDFITCICKVCKIETKYKRGGNQDGSFQQLEVGASNPVCCEKCGSKFVVHVLHTDEKKIDAV